IHGSIGGSGEFHAPLRDECGQQLIEQLHDAAIARELVRPEALDRLDAVLLHVAGDDAGEGAAQIGRELVHGLAAIERERAHRLVRDLERPLKLRLDREQPVEVVGIAALLAKLAHGFDAAHHAAGDLGGIVDDDGEALGRRLAERAGDEAADVLEIRGALARTGENDRQRLILVRGIENDPEEVQDFLGRARAAGEHHDAMREAHEGLEALLDVRHDDQLVDDRIRRLGRDDARLRDADITAVLDPLLRVADGRALHRALHGARSAARAYVEAPEAHLITDALAVLVLLGADRVSAPADHQIRPRLVVEEPGIAQYVEHRVGDVRGAAEVEAAARNDLVGDEYHVAQHGEEMLLDAADHLAVDEGGARSVVHLELDAPRVAHDADVEVAVAVEDLLGIVSGRAAVEHRQRAFAKERVEPSLP